MNKRLAAQNDAPPASDAAIESELAGDPSLQAVVASMLAPTGATSDPSTTSEGTEAPAASKLPDNAGASTTTDTPKDASSDAPEGEGADDFDVDGADFFQTDTKDAQTADTAAELTMDTLVPVTVDGEQRQVKLADLVKRYAGEGAIEKRLQEATELRTAAKREQEEIQRHVVAERARLANAMKALEHLILKPQVKMPDPNLQRTDPTAYVLQMEHYRQDQARLLGLKGVMDEALTAVEKDRTEVSNEVKQREAEALLRAIPALADPEKAPKVQQIILSAAKAHGFSDEEVRATVDHRLYQIVLKAGLYDQMISKRKLHPQVQQGSQNVIPAGSGSASRKPTPFVHKQRAAFQKASQTGSVEDVAATMLVPASRR